MIGSDYPQMLDDSLYDPGVRLRVWQPGGAVSTMPNFTTLPATALRLDTIVSNIDCKNNDARCFRSPVDNSIKFASNIGALVRACSCNEAAAGSKEAACTLVVCCTLLASMPGPVSSRVTAVLCSLRGICFSQ